MSTLSPEEYKDWSTLGVLMLTLTRLQISKRYFPVIQGIISKTRNQTLREIWNIPKEPK